MRSHQLNPLIFPSPSTTRQHRVALAHRRPAVDFATLLAERRQTLRNATPVRAFTAVPPRQAAASAVPQQPAAAAAAVPQPSLATGESIVAAARGQIGGAYVWGGEQPGAFDCSGLVRWAVRQATGRTIARVAEDQAQAGQPVARADLKAGDLVFFRNTGGREGITHVGVYAGDGQFIHAASEKVGIISSRLDEPYWARHYASARRVT